MAQALKRELEVFNQKQGELQNEHPDGGYVVIKDGEVLGVWKDREDALKEGIKAFGNVSFLIRDIYTDLDSISANFSKNLTFT